MTYMDFNQQNEYVKSKGVELPNGQIFLTKPLYVFKKVRTHPLGMTKRFARFDFAIENEKKDMFIDVELYGEEAVASLIIPVGSIVNPCNYDFKFRADNAVCWNIVRLDDGKFVNFGCSEYREGNKSPLVYKPACDSFGTTLTKMRLALELYNYSHEEFHTRIAIEKSLVGPEKPFDKSRNVCRSGIHFFLDSKTAEDY